MVLRYSIVHVFGFHTRIRPTNQMNNLVNISAQDIGRISQNNLKLRPIIVQDMTNLQKQMNYKKYNVLILPLTTSLVHKSAALMPLYNMHPPTEVSYRNLYFYVPPIGKERIQTLHDIQCNNLLNDIKIPMIPEYPLVGTEMQKENFLRKYLC